MSSTSAVRASCASAGSPFLAKSYHHNFAHELMVAQITASIELGTESKSARQAHHLARDLGPREYATARRASRRSPTAIRVSYSLRGERAPTRSMPTRGRSALSARSTASAATCSSPASRPIAAPSRSMPATPSAHRSPRNSPPTSPSPSKACTAPTSAFPISLSPSSPPARRACSSMMELLDRMTAGRGSKMLLFKTFPSFTSAGDGRRRRRPHADRAVAAGRLSAASVSIADASWTAAPRSSR